MYAEKDFDLTAHYCLEVLWMQEDFNVRDFQGSDGVNVELVSGTPILLANNKLFYDHIKKVSMVGKNSTIHYFK